MDNPVRANKLATILPDIMNALGDGDPVVQQALNQQKSKYMDSIKQQNMNAFMRTVMMPSTGEITPELVMQQADLFGVDPMEAMQRVQQFQQFRQKKQEMQSAYKRNPDGTMTKRSFPVGAQLPQGFEVGELAADPGYKKPEQFTLSPGQQRFDAGGQPVASLPDTPEKPNMGWITNSDGSRKYVELTPGTVSESPDTTKTNATDEKMKRIMEAYPNLEKEDAQKIALGTVTVKTDPVAGTHTLIDIGTGEEKPLNRDALISQDGEEPPAEPTQTIFSLAPDIAGPVPAAKAGASVPSGMVGGPVADEVIQARQYVTAAKNDFIRAMSINPRFPVGEIQRLEREVDLSPKVFSNPQVYRNKIIGINKYLRRRLQKELSVSSDQSMPVNDRKAARKAATDIDNFIDLLGVPPTIEKDMPRDEKQRIWDSLESGQQVIVDGAIKVKP